MAEDRLQVDAAGQHNTTQTEWISVCESGEQRERQG